MIRFALKGLLGRKLRTVLTALAIVLGVAMVSGTFVLTDSIDKAFDTIFTDIRQGSTAIVTGKPAFDLTEGGGSTAPPFDESVLEVVRGVDGVAQAEGSVDSDATQLIDENGDAVVSGGAPNLGFSIAQGDSPFNPLELVSGAWPGTGEVAIDSGTAEKEGWSVGDTIGVQAEGPIERFRVSGIAKFRSSLSLGGATLAGFDLPTAQRLFGKLGKLDEIAVAAKPGVSDAELIQRIRDVLPEGTQVRSGQQQAREDAADTSQFIDFLRNFLLAFGGVALFVGSFVIANSLSITIAQRMRELATLRTIGASRAQVLRSIVAESLVVGVLASVAGLLLGLALAKGLFSLFDAVGFTLPNSGLVFRTRTVVVALAVGILVTLLASLRPGPAGDARAADRRGAGGSRAPAGALCPLPHRVLGGPDRARVRAASPRAVRLGPRHDRGAAADARWRARHLPRRGDAVGAVHPPPGRRARLARLPVRRCGRCARARQLPAQPPANRVDGRGADDRPRARHPRGRARGRDHPDVQGRGRRPLEERRLRDHRAEQLLAASDRSRRRRGRRAGCDRCGERPYR